jgi:hypothetical protein
LGRTPDRTTKPHTHQVEAIARSISPICSLFPGLSSVSIESKDFVPLDRSIEHEDGSITNVYGDYRVDSDCVQVVPMQRPASEIAYFGDKEIELETTQVCFYVPFPAPRPYCDCETKS